MRIAMIAALAQNRVIGDKNSLPWHLPADLKHFKSLTLGKPVLMGRNTYESIGRPLPGRLNIVLTGDRTYQAPGCQVVHSVAQALEAARGHEEVMVIGGARLYEQMLGVADRLYLTHVKAETKGDVRFPEFDQDSWREVEHESHPADDRNEYAYDFVVLDRVKR